MADLRAAILNAALEADRLHKRFDTKSRADAGEGRIDVFDMLVQNDIPVMFQQLRGLLGAFLDDLADAGFAVVRDALEADADEDSYGGVVFRTVIAEPKEDGGAEGHVFLRETRPW